MSKRYYLAYGSNLNINQMRMRCPDSKVVSKGFINDYELLFKGSLTGAYLTIEEKKGGLHAGQLRAHIQLCLALSQMAKEAKSASAKPQQQENKKYAMRTWLLRLGFIGEEFKTARELYMSRLDGNAAWRSEESRVRAMQETTEETNNEKVGAENE